MSEQIVEQHFYMIRRKHTGEWITRDIDYGFQVWMSRDEAVEALTDEAHYTDSELDDLELVEFAPVMPQQRKA